MAEPARGVSGRARSLARGAAFLLLAVVGFCLPHHAAQAQAIVVVVNGDPVTTLDVDQRMKLLRVLHRPASREAAVESMIIDRLKSREARRYGVTIKDNEIGEGVSLAATRMKIPSAQLAAELEHNVQREHLVNYFKSELGFYIILKEMNKGVEASEVAVRAELAKAGGKSSMTQYTVRQIVFTVTPGDPPSLVATEMKQAEALRGKFSSCEQGIPYAKSLTGVAVREEFTRTSTTLPAQIKELLDKTPIGHLTPPSRSGSGIEMIAVCGRGAPKDDTDLRKQISERLIQAHIDQEVDKRIKELREHAVVEKR